MNNTQKIWLTICIFLSGTLFVNGQSSISEQKLDSIIQVCIAKIDAEETLGNMMWSANMMERVVNLNNSWSSNYYLCYFYLLVAMEMDNEDQKMVYYNSFMKQYEVAEKLAKTDQEKSELLTLLAFLKIDLLTVDPLKYGKELSGEITDLFNEAIELFPNNPRAIYLNAIYKTGMANFFKKEGNFCNEFLQANKLFIKAYVHQDNYLLPKWGAEHNSVLIMSCYGENN